MGVLQDKGRISKLHVLNQLYGALTVEQKAELGESFEKAAAKVMGKAWEEGGYSIEFSGVQVEWYMRGALSATSPVNIDSSRLMKGVALRTMSIEPPRLSFESSSNLGALLNRGNKLSVDSTKQLMLSRLGFDEESHESIELAISGGIIGGLYLAATIAEAMKKRREKIAAKKKEDEPLVPDDISWDGVHKIPRYLDQHLSDARIDSLTEKEGKISGDGIVKRLTWGHQFDEKDPVGFLTKMFAQYDAFYHKYEPIVDHLDKVVQADQKTTRPAVMAVKDDEDKFQDVLKEATDKLKAEFAKAHTFFGNCKTVFPNGRMIDIERTKKEWNRVIDDPAAKPISQIRPLTKDEAKKMVDLLSKAATDLKKYTTIFNRRWSDHSDGDPFWDVAERAGSFDDYCGYIYHQSVDAALLDYVDDISEIVAAVTMGALTWIDRSFKKPGSESNESGESLDKRIHRLGCQSTRIRVLASRHPVPMTALLGKLESLDQIVKASKKHVDENERLYDTVCESWYLSDDEFDNDTVAMGQFLKDLTAIEKGLSKDMSNESASPDAILRNMGIHTPRLLEIAKKHPDEMTPIINRLWGIAAKVQPGTSAYQMVVQIHSGWGHQFSGMKDDKEVIKLWKSDLSYIEQNLK